MSFSFVFYSNFLRQNTVLIMFVFPDRTPVPQDPVASLASLVTMAPQIPQATLVQTLAELFSTLSQASTSNKT